MTCALGGGTATSFNDLYCCKTRTHCNLDKTRSQSTFSHAAWVTQFVSNAALIVLVTRLSGKAPHGHDDEEDVEEDEEEDEDEEDDDLRVAGGAATALACAKPSGADRGSD